MKILIHFIKLDDDCSFVIHFYNLKLTFSYYVKAVAYRLSHTRQLSDHLSRQKCRLSGASRVQHHSYSKQSRGLSQTSYFRLPLLTSTVVAHRLLYEIFWVAIFLSRPT